MKLVNPSQPLSQTRDYAVIVYANGGGESVDIARIQAELVMNVEIDGQTALRVVCSPNNLAELVLGRLLTEGIIQGVQDAESIVVEEGGRTAHVQLRNRFKDGAFDMLRETTSTSSAADGGSYAESSSLISVTTCDSANQVVPVRFACKDPLPQVTPIPYEKEWLFNLATKFAEDTPMHKKTWGAHSCWLALQDRLLYCCEDLGRHNALDKVIGCALRDGVDLTQAILYSSGRVPVDMLQKVIRAGVPIMMSKAVPTEESIKLARKHALTLICSARPDSMKVFNAPKPKAAPAAAANDPKTDDPGTNSPAANVPYCIGVPASNGPQTTNPYAATPSANPKA